MKGEKRGREIVNRRNEQVSRIRRKGGSKEETERGREQGKV